MSIEIPKEAKAQAVASIQRYFDQNLDESIGNVGAAALLEFFLDEVGGLIYNQGVQAVQETLQARLAEIDIEVYQEPFQYWGKHKSRSGK